MKQTQIFRRKKVPETIQELTDRIKVVMVKHIGVNKEITKGELFKKLFGNPNNYTEIQYWWLWDKVKHSMNWLRRTSNCFIASRQVVPSVWAYFVVKNRVDLQFYKDTLRSNIRKMYSMIARGEKLVSKKAYKFFLEEMGK